MGKWLLVLGALAVGAAGAAPLPFVPDSLRILIVRYREHVGSLSGKGREPDELTGTFYTQIDPIEREALTPSGQSKYPRMQPLVAYHPSRAEAPILLPWMESRGIAQVAAMMRQPKLRLLVEFEDETWGLARPGELQIDVPSERLYFTVHIIELQTNDCGAANERTRVMRLPLEQVPDRVQANPAEWSADPKVAYYLTDATDDRLLPVSVLAFDEREHVWVVPTSELAVGETARLLRVRREVLRRSPLIHRPARDREAQQQLFSREWLKPITRYDERIPEAEDPLTYLRKVLRHKVPHAIHGIPAQSCVESLPAA